MLTTAQILAPRYIPNPADANGGPGPTIAPGVTTVGVRRPVARGTAGRALVVTIPEATIHHYDVGKLIEIQGTQREMPVKFNLDLIRILQEHVAPSIFTPRVVYDGRKNIFASRALNLSGGDSQTFEVPMPPPREGGRPPRVYEVTLRKVAEINPTLLDRYQSGQQSYDNMVSTALTAINVIIRMQPIM